MTHPAQHHVNASHKRQKSWVEGRARGGRLDRPGKKFGGAAERKDGQSTADEYPGPENKHERAGPYGSEVRARGGRADGGDIDPDAATMRLPTRPITRSSGQPGRWMGKNDPGEDVPIKTPEGKARGGKLTTADRRELPSKDFALPRHGSGPEGKGSGSYPIPDENHARNALARAAQHASPAERATIRRKVHAKFPDIKES
jgi:hypothetical protein